MSIQKFKQAMAQVHGKETPPVIHADSRVHTYRVGSKEYYYIALSKKYDNGDEVTAEAAGYFGTLAGAGKTYAYASEYADRVNAGDYKGKDGKWYRIHLIDVIENRWYEFIGKRQEEMAAWFRAAWEKMEKHPDGQQRVREGARYRAVQNSSGEISGMVRVFPDFQIIDGSDFFAAFVLLGEAEDKPEQIVIAHKWEDAEQINKVTGMPTLFLPDFRKACDYEIREEAEQLWPEAKIIIVDNPEGSSTSEWKAHPDGLEPRWGYESAKTGLPSKCRLLKLDHILKGIHPDDDLDLSPLDAPELEFSLESGADSAAKANAVSYVVRDAIPKQTLIELHASPGEGKTTLLLQALGAIATGTDFLGLKTEKCPVVVCNYENAPSALKALIERIHGADRIYFLDNPPQLDQPEWTRLKMVVSNLGMPVILIDTLASSCAGSDIGSNADFAPVMKRLIELRNMGATIILLNHTLKRDPTKFIGAQVIISQSDHVMSLAAESNGIYRFGTSGKTRYGHYEMALRFDQGRKLFVPADDPDQTEIDSIKSAIAERPSLSVQELAASTGIAEKKLRHLLDRHETRHWKSDRGAKNAKLYFPV